MGTDVTRCSDAGCRRVWTAETEAHCTACHQHFGGATIFDLHQITVDGDLVCRTPAQLRKKGLAQKRDRFGGRTWKRPPPEKGKWSN